MSTAQQLEEALGQKLDRRETTSDWRGGFLYIWSPVMGRFVQRQMVAVRPHEEDAARAYDTAAIREFGDFAVTNFPRIGG